ncbi:MAG: hypothetical protein GY719_41175 [bacterium]|nr:hypothetical protein [bacterium]
MSPRAFLRVPPIALATVLAAGSMLVLRVLRPVAPRLQLTLRNAAFRAWGRILCRLMGMRIEVEGTPPSGRFLLVANHVSYVDIMLIASQVSAAFVGKADLRGWPLLGWGFGVSDTIFIDRARKKDILQVTGRVKDCLTRGLGVAIFPEGTTGNGEDILRLKPALLQLAAEEGQGVLYATVSYRTEGQPTARQTVCWWDDTPFMIHLLRLLSLPSFEATLRFGEQPIHADDRKLLAEQLREAMMRIFTPIV